MRLNKKYYCLINKDGVVYQDSVQKTRESVVTWGAVYFWESKWSELEKEGYRIIPIKMVKVEGG